MATEQKAQGGQSCTACHKPEKSFMFLSPTGSGPEGVDSDLASELLSHAQDTHGHAVLRHGVR